MSVPTTTARNRGRHSAQFLPTPLSAIILSSSPIQHKGTRITCSRRDLVQLVLGRFVSVALSCYSSPRKVLSQALIDETTLVCSLAAASTMEPTAKLTHPCPTHMKAYNDARSTERGNRGPSNNPSDRVPFYQYMRHRCFVIQLNSVPFSSPLPRDSVLPITKLCFARILRQRKRGM